MCGDSIFLIENFEHPGTVLLTLGFFLSGSDGVDPSLEGCGRLDPAEPE
jgi:hypothetical protein